MNLFILLWYLYYEISPGAKIQSFPVFSACHLGASLLQIVADLRPCCLPYPLPRPRSLHGLRDVDLDWGIPWIQVREVNPCRLSCETFWVDWTGMEWIMGPAEGAVVKVEWTAVYASWLDHSWHREKGRAHAWRRHPQQVDWRLGLMDWKPGFRHRGSSLNWAWLGV